MHPRHLFRSLLPLLALVLLTTTQANAASFYALDLLGSDELGLVQPGQPLSYQHTFTPSRSGNVHILSAHLGITLADAPNCTQGSASQRSRCMLHDMLFEPEHALIETNGQAFAQSHLTLPWVGGNVTPMISGPGDSLDVTITALAGEFRAKQSWLLVRYEIRTHQQPGGAIPEPTAALLFGAGLLVSLRSLRRR